MVAADALTAPDVVVRVETPSGVAECLIGRPAGRPTGVLLIGHGAGGDLEAPDLAELAAAGRRAGLAVVGVRQPYRVAGRRAAAPATHLDAAWAAVVQAVRSGQLTSLPRSARVFAAGRSSGARVACRTASALGIGAVLGLAFPLHPPGRPERSRADELAAGVPLRILQGSRDAFGRPAEFPADVDVVVVDGADHGLKTGRPLGPLLADAVSWMLALPRVGASKPPGIGAAHATL